MRFVKGDEVFQQDGAPPDRVLEALAYLDKICVRESSRKVVPWYASGVCALNGPRSPDLSLLDYWFWETTKSRILDAGPWPTTRLDMVAAIRREADAMYQDEIDRSIRKITSRPQQCLDRESGNFEQFAQ